MARAGERQNAGRKTGRTSVHWSRSCNTTQRGLSKYLMYMKLYYIDYIDFYINGSLKHIKI